MGPAGDVSLGSCSPPMVGRPEQAASATAMRDGTRPTQRRFPPAAAIALTSTPLRITAKSANPSFSIYRRCPFVPRMSPAFGDFVLSFRTADPHISQVQQIEPQCRRVDGKTNGHEKDSR